VSVKVSSSNCFCLSSIPLSVSGFKPLYKFFQSFSVYGNRGFQIGWWCMHQCLSSKVLAGIYDFPAC